MTSALRPWLLAFRPKTLTAAFVPVAVATALVYRLAPQMSLWLSFCALLSAAFIQIGTNLVNDALDFKKGADTTERLGPKRATQMGWLKPSTVLWGGFAAFFLAAMFGLPLVMSGGWVILVIGIVSLICGYLYTGGPAPLAYKGLGDLFVILFFGLVAVGGVYYVYTKTYSLDAFVAGLQVGLLATVLIAINNLRDHKQDAKVGKMTLAVRLGERGTRWEIFLLIALTMVLQLYWISVGEIGASILGFGVITGPAFVLIRNVMNTPVGPVYNLFLAQAALLHLLFGISLSLGLVLL